MDIKVEENSTVEMKRSCLCFCLACGATGLQIAIDGEKEESFDHASDIDGQLSAFLLLKGCSRCSNGKVYKLSDCDYFSRIRVGIYLSEFIREAVDEFGDEIDLVENYDHRKGDVDVVVNSIVTESEALFNSEVGQIECVEDCFTHERKVPFVWKESVERLFHVNSVVGAEDGEGGEDSDGEDPGEDQLVRGVKLVNLEG